MPTKHAQVVSFSGLSYLQCLTCRVRRSYYVICCTDVAELQKLEMGKAWEWGYAQVFYEMDITCVSYSKGSVHKSAEVEPLCRTG